MELNFSDLFIDMVYADQQGTKKHMMIPPYHYWGLDEQGTPMVLRLATPEELEAKAAELLAIREKALKRTNPTHCAYWVGKLKQLRIKIIATLAKRRAKKEYGFIIKHLKQRDKERWAHLAACDRSFHT